MRLTWESVTSAIQEKFCRCLVASVKTMIRSSKIDISDSQLTDLGRRIAATRWPITNCGASWDRGVPPHYLKELATYWQNEYDWRRAEQELNRYPQFTTEIDGVNVHFLHIRSDEPGARPLLLTHGWPSSVVEFLDVIGPLTDPRAHGGDPAGAFHLVVPSLPGHGFSGPITGQPGWNISRVAGAWAELMSRLGYDSYITGGGDWGSIISLELGRIDPGHVAGAHASLVLTTPSGDPAEMAGLSELDRSRLDSTARFYNELSGYLRIQTTRPQTITYGLTDSPVGQLAWIAEKFRDWNSSVARPEDLVSRDRLLTNVSIYWFTETAGSAAELYYESAAYLQALFTPGRSAGPVHVPLAVAAFAQAPTPPIRAFVERDFPTLAQWSEFDGAGHFGIFEKPADFVNDIRSFAGILKAKQTTT